MRTHRVARRSLASTAPATRWSPPVAAAAHRWPAVPRLRPPRRWPCSGSRRPGSAPGWLADADAHPCAAVPPNRTARWPRRKPSNRQPANATGWPRQEPGRPIEPAAANRRRWPPPARPTQGLRSARKIRSPSAPNPFVVILHRFAKSLRDRIPIDRDHRVLLRGPPQQLGGNFATQAFQGLRDHLADQRPLRLGRATIPFPSHLPSPLADPRRFGAQVGIFDQLFDIAHRIGPLTKAFAGQRRRDRGVWRGFGPLAFLQQAA